LLCTLLQPQFLFEHNEGGVSNFGIHALTVVPYSLAFGLSSLFLALAARALPSKTVRRLLYILGTLQIFVLASTYPYKLNRSLDNLHILAAIALFVAELAVGVWFAFFLRKNTANLALLGLQTLGFLLALLTLVGWLHVLMVRTVSMPAARDMV